MKRSYTDVDLSRLEEDFLAQPRLMDRATKGSADAKKDLAELKAEMEVVEAECKRRIRKNPGKYGIVGSRPTKDMIDEALVLHPKYQEINVRVIEAQHKVDVFGGLINTLEHRKRTIEGLITLHGQGYWSKPRVSRAADESFAKDVDARRQEHAFSRKRKKNKKGPI